MTIKADTQVKWFHSGMADAPVLRGEAGALVELLDACLINGFGSRTADSIVVSGGVATVALGAGNPFEQHVVVKIEGATPAELNAEWKVATSAAASFTFACPGIADGTATGTITVQRAAAGWGKPYSDTNVAVYQSLDPNGTQLYLRVNDADARYTRVRGYEDMSDANTGTGLFPTLAQNVETAYTWWKSSVADTSARSWTLVADGSFFHFHPRPLPSYLPVAQYFGDIVKALPSDQYHCAIVAHNAASPTSPGINHPGTNGVQGGTRFLARGHLQSGTALEHGVQGAGVGLGWGGYNTSPAPGLAGEVYIGPLVWVTSGTQTTTPIRGTLPGAFAPVQTALGTGGSIIETPDGRVFILLSMSFGASGSSVETFAFFDIKGPWR